MRLITIADADVNSDSNFREHCARLEAGDILFFPQSPINIAPEDLEFLLNQQQVGAGYHKNIAYRPGLLNQPDRVTGFAKTSPDAEARLLRIMRGYSQSVVRFLTEFLAPYQARWHLDYASFRPQAEESRQLALRKRNDLLHTDAFPTRPTSGDRILRFFNNINPTETRDWVTGGTFAELAAKYAGDNKPFPLPHPVSAASRARQAIGKLPVVHSIFPRWARSPYDAFMMDFHNFLKENADYQQSCEKLHLNFAPGSSWMVYTDTVSHAVLRGQFALEQTLLVRHAAMVAPACSPLRVLENLAGGKLA